MEEVLIISSDECIWIEKSKEVNLPFCSAKDNQIAIFGKSSFIFKLAILLNRNYVHYWGGPYEV